MFARTPAQSGRRQYRSHSVRPYRFTSRAALSASSSGPLDGATPLRGVVQQNLCTVQAARHFPSLPSCVWSNTDARLAECEFVPPRRFCLEVLAKLPRGSRLQVEAPLALLQAMQAASPWTIVDGDRGRVPINPHGRHRLGCAYFPPKHAFPLRLLVHVPEEFRGHRYDVAVRQLYEAEEVGRVTWRLVPAALA